MDVERSELAFYTSGRSAFARDGRAVVAAFDKGRTATAKSPAPHNATVVGQFQPARLFRRLCRDQQGLSGQMNALLTEAERERVLAKSALFNPPPVQLPDGRRELVGLSRDELAAELAAIGEKPFRAKQLWHWVYHQGATDFTRMSTIARPLQAKLAERFVVGRPDVATVQTSTDETRKWLFRFRDGQEAETVYIPDRTEDRGAVCISSQVGCTLSCRFCHTGTQRLVRNLGAAEIVGQFMAARDAYGEWPSPQGETPRLLSTIVLMGMGEPLYNYENVAKAMRIVMDGEGIGLSRRRITLSTSGVVPIMDRCGTELGVNLAVSLHAVTDALRDEIVPLNRKYPLAELLAACRRYPGRQQCAADHLRVRDAARRQRQRGGGARAGAADRRHPGQGEPDPVQPVARQRLSAEHAGAVGTVCPRSSPTPGSRARSGRRAGRTSFAACGQLKTESAKARSPA